VGRHGEGDAGLPEVGSISVSRLDAAGFSAMADHRDRGPVLHPTGGLFPSSLARRYSVFDIFSAGSRCRRTSGVSPMKSSIPVHFAGSAFTYSRRLLDGHELGLIPPARSRDRSASVKL